jgi:UDP-glucose 4-epimerase
MKILVTGGAGFVGGILLQRLRAVGHDLRVLDDLSTGRAERVGPCELVVGDVRDPERVAHAMEGVDAVVHLAAQSSVPISLHDPVACHAVNAHGSAVVLEAARRQGVSRVVLASSAAVYGLGTGRSALETDSLDPRSPYAASKVAMEALARVYSLDMSLVILRYFNVYGGGAYTHWGDSVVSRFQRALERGEALPVEGDGLQARDFVHVEDVAQANLCALEGPCGTYNVGTGHATTVSDLARIMMEAADCTVAVESRPARREDLQTSCADPRLATSALGFRATLALEQGLALGTRRFPARQAV